MTLNDNAIHKWYIANLIMFTEAVYVVVDIKSRSRFLKMEECYVAEL